MPKLSNPPKRLPHKDGYHSIAEYLRFKNGTWEHVCHHYRPYQR